MAKVSIIGIDGLDPFLLDKWKDELPNFSHLIGDQTDFKTQSTVPPDSICAWTSIYSGKNPAEHGLIESINYLSDKKLDVSQDRSSVFRGKTFWDIAGDMGKSVCVINPFIAYPAWEVNGVMVSGPVFEGGDTNSFPEDILEKYNFPSLGGIVDFPRKEELDTFLKSTVKLTRQLTDVSLKIYEDYNPDLFFLAYLTLDRVKHFFWRYVDSDDPYYPGDNPYKNSIKDMYKVFDEVLGDFREKLGKDEVLMVISDHGHRRRCSYCLNLNEFLRKEGYLKVSGGGVKGSLKKIVEKSKVFTVSTLNRYGLEDWIYRIARFVPHRKALRKSTYLIDKGGSGVTLSNLCGANPHGGMDIRGETPEEYEALREKVIRQLKGINKKVGKDVVKWAKKREDVYRGENEASLPDIIFELDEDFGVGMDMFTSLISPNFTHRKISGGHKNEAVLIVYSNDNDAINDLEKPSSVIGMSEYILKIIDA